jgi:hypothetical protein
VTVILAGDDNFWRSLRAADDLAIELSRRRCLAQSGTAFLFKLVVGISIRNVRGDFKARRNPADAPSAKVNATDLSPRAKTAGIPQET